MSLGLCWPNLCESIVVVYVVKAVYKQAQFLRPLTTFYCCRIPSGGRGSIQSKYLLEPPALKSC